MALIDYTSGTEKLYYYHNDHLGTPLALSNQTQQVVWTVDYSPFGSATVNEDPDGDGNKVEQNLRFAGQYYDKETGLHYNWNRYYDPSTGRYITSDPIGLEGGINTYGYAVQNPVRYTDPEGLAIPLVLPALPAIGKIAGPLIGIGLGIGIIDAMDDGSSNNDEPGKCDDKNKEESSEKERKMRENGWVPLGEIPGGTPYIPGGPHNGAPKGWGKPLGGPAHGSGNNPGGIFGPGF